MAMTDLATAAAIMRAFAVRTGLVGTATPVRYLWTDAFAVCNFLGMGRAQGAADLEDLVDRTIAQVHAVLAHFRPDDRRRGWLRGPHGCADAEHPTRGGLCIGKPLPERAAGEPPDERLEWERDGQYFHYLTRWMQALDQVARVRGEGRLNRWACELAATAHQAFVQSDRDGRPRMVWKMSTDLARPLVASMGQHDPLDGLLTARTLRQTARRLGTPAVPDLAPAIADYARLLDGLELATADPLGLGGLLTDILRLARLSPGEDEAIGPSLERLLESAVASLPHAQRQLGGPPSQRLAFRELGLAVGLAAIERLAADPPSAPRERALLDVLLGALPLRQAIHGVWLQPAARTSTGWNAHRDINDVMLATSLAPDGWLGFAAQP